MSTITGQEYQHATIDFWSAMPGVLAGEGFQFTHFKSLNYKIGAKKEAVRDHRGKITSFTIKEEETDGNLVVLKSQWIKFKKAVYQLAPVSDLGKPLGIGQIMFDWTITYGNSLNSLQTDNVYVMFQEDARKSEDNQDALVTELPLFVFDVGGTETPFINY